MSDNIFRRFMERAQDISETYNMAPSKGPYTSNIDDTERTGASSLTIGQVISKLYEMIQNGHEPDEPLLLGNSGYTLTVVGEKDGRVYIG